MKRVLKGVAIVLGLLLVLGAAGAGFMFSQMPRPTEERIQVEPDVVGVLQKFAYVWIVRSPRGAVLIDSGPDLDPTAVLAELRAEKLGPADVQAVLLTHRHPDHWAGAHLFSNAKVYVGPGDASLVRGERHQLPAFLEKWMRPPDSAIPSMTELGWGRLPGSLGPGTHPREHGLSAARRPVHRGLADEAEGRLAWLGPEGLL